MASSDDQRISHLFYIVTSEVLYIHLECSLASPILVFWMADKVLFALWLDLRKVFDSRWRLLTLRWRVIEPLTTNMRSGFSECKSGCKEAFKCCELVDSGNRGAFMEVTRREGEKKETKGRETKMMGGIQMHLSSRVNPLVCLFSFHLGHWTQKKGSPVLNLCVCKHLEVFCVCEWLAEREGTCRCVHTCRMDSVRLWKHEYACLHKRWRKLVHTHMVAFFYHTAVWPEVVVWKIFSLLWGPLCPSA